MGWKGGGVPPVPPASHKTTWSSMSCGEVGIHQIPTPAHLNRRLANISQRSAASPFPKQISCQGKLPCEAPTKSSWAVLHPTSCQTFTTSSITSPPPLCRKRPFITSSITGDTKATGDHQILNLFLPPHHFLKTFFSPNWATSSSFDTSYQINNQVPAQSLLEPLTKRLRLLGMHWRVLVEGFQLYCL